VYIQLQPVGNNDTENVECELNGDELSTRGMRRSLGSPDGGSGVEHTDTHAVEDTRSNRHAGVLSARLKGTGASRPGGSDSNGLDTSVAITEPATEEATDECTGEIEATILHAFHPLALTILCIPKHRA
jgi:hypothetical protein